MGDPIAPEDLAANAFTVSRIMAAEVTTGTVRGATVTAGQIAANAVTFATIDGSGR